MTEALLDLQSGDGTMFGPPRNNENSLFPMEIGMTTANGPTVNTPVVACDSSQEQPASAANSLATDNVPVAQITTDQPHSVSPVEQILDSEGANISPPPANKNPHPLKEVPVSTANDSTINTPVVAGESSQAEVAPATSSLATDNVPVAQIENQPPDPVSAGDQTLSAAGANSNRTPGSAATTPAPDPFDPAALGLSQDFAAADGLKRVLLSLPVRKPANTWFVRVHTDPAYRLETMVIELKDDHEMYLVAPSLRSSLAAEPTFGVRALYTAVNRDGVPFIWPVRLPSAEGKIDEWSRTAKEAAALAMKSWVRMAANTSRGTYDVTIATASVAEPAWPQESFKELLQIAFKDRYIDSIDHPVLRKLRGVA
jgi:hypothetical protein